MFVVLEHRTGGKADPNAVHWDFLIEVPDQKSLAAWRLRQSPIAGPETVAAERIADHRRAFLDYEGPLRRVAGSVQRVDRGEAIVARYVDPELRAQLRGVHLVGVYEIVADEAGGLVFHRAPAPH